MTMPMPALSEEALESLRADVVARLKQIGVYQDDVLPQYILVMVKNRKPEHEINEQLAMFLGEDSNLFVQWLASRVNAVAQEHSPEPVQTPKATLESASSEEEAADNSDANLGSKRNQSDDEQPIRKRARAEPTLDTYRETDVAKRPVQCSFYPNCTKGAACPFYHPPNAQHSTATRMCSKFPFCEWGDDCLFQHPRPACRYGPACSNRGCGYNHAWAARPRVPAGGGGHSTSHLVRCRFHPHCNKPACPYHHPTMCRYGGSCNNINCTYDHETKSKPKCRFGATCTRPQCQFQHDEGVVPHHISERDFAVGEVDGNLNITPAMLDIVE